MTEKELAEHIAMAVGDVDLADTDIPAIDLYLDQILSLFSDANALSSPRYRERSLTKTMVNNYSKEGLISPINGKKYGRAHIVEMLLVYSLKNTLSIDEIKRVLTGVREGCGFTGDDLIDAYHQFLSIKERNRARTGDLLAALVKEDRLDARNDRDFFVLLLDILSLCGYLKELGRELLEARYAHPDDVERERKEEKDAEKRERRRRDAQAKAAGKKTKEE